MAALPPPTMEEVLASIGITWAQSRPETSITALGDVGRTDLKPTPAAPGDVLQPAPYPSPNEPFHVHVASFCSQHKTGTAVESITKFLGVLSPSFCLASCLANGDVADKLYIAICDLLDRNMDVCDPAKLAFDAADERELAFQEVLLLSLIHI